MLFGCFEQPSTSHKWSGIDGKNVCLFSLSMSLPLLLLLLLLFVHLSELENFPFYRQFEMLFPNRLSVCLFTASMRWAPQPPPPVIFRWYSIASLRLNVRRLTWLRAYTTPTVLMVWWWASGWAFGCYFLAAYHVYNEGKVICHVAV